MPNIALARLEQETIVRFIHSETGTLIAAISRLEREIDLLREYRTRLVADVVTGKLDVREAAARLPEDAAPDDSDSDPDLDAEVATRQLRHDYADTAQALPNCPCERLPSIVADACLWCDAEVLRRTPFTQRRCQP